MSVKNPIESLTKDITKVPAALKRSPEWEETRRRFVLQHPQCEVCAKPTSDALNVHHIIPYDIAAKCGRPDLECDFRNLITLCEGQQNHHYVVGHLCDWQAYNQHIRRDARRLDCKGESSERIMSTSWWLEACQISPQGNTMSPDDFAALKHALDNLYPINRSARLESTGQAKGPAANTSSARQSGGADLGRALFATIQEINAYILILSGAALLGATATQSEWLASRPFVGFGALGALLLGLGLRARFRRM